jgi:hypothetical protein
MSKVPAAIDRLVLTLTTALPDVQIIDGPPIINLEEVGIAIGYTPDQISVQAVSDGAGLVAEMETFDINCLAWQRSGEGEMKTIRDGVFAVIAAVNVILANDRKLGGAVTNAQLRVVDLDQTQTPDGTWAVVAFVVTCKAFT